MPFKNKTQRVDKEVSEREKFRRLPSSYQLVFRETDYVVALVTTPASYPCLSFLSRTKVNLCLHHAEMPTVSVLMFFLVNISVSSFVYILGLPMTSASCMCSREFSEPRRSLLGTWQYLEEEECVLFMVLDTSTYISGGRKKHPIVGIGEIL